MDDVVASPAYRLYETDFYAWTQEQAALLRAGRLAQLDVANLLEEIETLGRTEVPQLLSRLTVLVQHLLKEIHRPEQASRSWVATVVVQRQKLKRHVRDNPSLKPRIMETFAEAYADARKVAAAETGLPGKTFAEEPPFSYEEVMDEAFWPGRSVADRG